MPSQPGPGRSVLVVDDESDIRDLISEALTDEGFVVTTAANGREAIERLSASTGLILLDVFMPEMDGLDVLKVLRERRVQVPVLLVSAAPDLASIAKEHGADGFLRKPFEIASLLASVTRNAGSQPWTLGERTPQA